MGMQGTQTRADTYDETLGQDFVRNYLYSEKGLNAQYPGITYYRVPPIKHSDYGMKTAISFFCEGMAGASQLLGTILSFTGREGDQGLVGAVRYIALAGGIAAPSVFIADLHTKQRWFNMLRIFKRTSVMSIGTWSLSLFGLFSGITAASQWLKDLGFPLVGESIAKVSQVPAAVSGGVISLYMGTELESTTTPLWSEESPLLPALFAIGDVANTLAAMEIAAVFTRAHPTTRRRIDELAILAGIARLGLGSRVVRLWSREQADSSVYRALFRFGVMGAGVVLPVGIRLLQLASGWRSRAASVTAGVSTLIGGFLFPALLLMAGNESARKPENYFESTKPATIEGRLRRNAVPPAPRAVLKERRRKQIFKWIGGISALAAAGTLIAATARRGR